MLEPMKQMSTISLDGRSLAALLQEEERHYLSHLLNAHQLPKPKLCVILIGDLAASLTYVNTKKVACEKVGIEAEILHLEGQCSQKQVIETLQKLNKDPLVHGILVQLPLPPGMDTATILDTIDPLKDVDGLHCMNAGRLVLGDTRAMIPCTPKGIVRMLQHYKIETTGKHVAIIGRSSIVGRPLSILMSHQAWKGNSTVSLLHSKSENIQEMTQQADIVVAAAGRQKMVNSSYIKPGAVVIDVGIHRLADGSLCGDVDTASLQGIAAAFSPVPGGVGPMTVAMVVENVLTAWARHYKAREPK